MKGSVPKKWNHHSTFANNNNNNNNLVDYNGVCGTAGQTSRELHSPGCLPSLSLFCKRSILAVLTINCRLHLSQLTSLFVWSLWVIKLPSGFPTETLASGGETYFWKTTKRKPPNTHTFLMSYLIPLRFPSSEMELWVKRFKSKTKYTLLHWKSRNKRL